MYVIFFFIHLVFASVFYFFDRIPETVVFSVLGAVFFFAFWPFDFKKKQDAPIGWGVSKIASEAKSKAVEFLKSGTYYLGFLFFYLSLYGIAYSSAESFGVESNVLYGWLTISLSVLSAWAYAAFWPKHDVASKIFRSNAFVFSTVHFSLLSYRLFSWGEIDAVFVTNVVLSIGSLATVVLAWGYADFRQRNAAFLFFLAYVYVCSVALAMRTFGFGWAVSSMTALFLESVVVFDGLTRVRKLREYRSVWAYFGAALSYLSVLSVFAYALSFGIDAYVLVMAFAISSFQVYLHAKYENYLSVASVILISAFLYFQAFYPTPSSGFFPYFLFCFWFPVGVAVFAKWKTFHGFDGHFLFGAGILHAFVCFVAYFFRFSSYSVLEISLLSLGFSILSFVSYLGLRK